MLDRYQDMLDLPRPPSPSHAPMRRRDRAAQFAPFAALTGFDEQIRKVAWMQRSAFPYEGKGHGEAVTDEVGHLRLRAAVHLISRLRRQLPLIGEAIGRASCRGEANKENLPAKRCSLTNSDCTFY